MCIRDRTKIDQQVVELVKREHDKAVDILTANREKLDRLAAVSYTHLDVYKRQALRVSAIWVMPVSSP